MADILISDVPYDVVAAIDAKARRVGLSRTEYLHRTLERERIPQGEPVTVAQVGQLARLARDLEDPDIVSDAWS